MDHTGARINETLTQTRVRVLACISLFVCSAYVRKNMDRKSSQVSIEVGTHKMIHTAD